MGINVATELHYREWWNGLPPMKFAAVSFTDLELFTHSLTWGRKLPYLEETE